MSTLRTLTNTSRRDFLKASATGSAGLLLAFYLPGVAAGANTPKKNSNQTPTSSSIRKVTFAWW